MAKVDDILSNTLAATKVGKLQWELVGRDSFRTQVGKLFLAIAKYDNEFTFTIYDDDGNLLDSSAGYYSYTQADLYELVRRTALRIDDTLESLDQQLRELI